MLTKQIWIGAYRTGPGTSDFAWTDGSIWKYSNWGLGHPDTASQNCVAANEENDGRWDDHDCYNTYQYLCQAQAVGYKGNRKNLVCD